jgi:glycosyltransferase involved in cell wall biosynthesis
VSDPPVAQIRIGMICPHWLPRHGGAQQYEYRLAQALLAQGFDVRVFCGTAAREGFDNGDIAATRFTPRGDFALQTWSAVGSGANAPDLAQLFNHYAFMEQAFEWSKAHAIQVALIGQPFQRTGLYHVRELHLQLKAIGVKVGVIHYDLARPVEDALHKIYLQAGLGWEHAASAVLEDLRGFLRSRDALQALFTMGSPLFFSPDFVVSCSEWSSRFIDPHGTTPKLVLHPLLDRAHWGGSASGVPLLEHKDILMVNPQGRKGPRLMANLIASAGTQRTFRVLRGGWGAAFAQFKPLISGLPAFVEGRVELLDHVKDMREAYRAAGMVFFPSLFEGYGLTAVEPMYGGVPVVSGNYPAILEAVGDAAYTLCPHTSTKEEWRDGVEEVLASPQAWRARGLARAAQLDARQSQEVGELAQFLRALV